MENYGGIKINQKQSIIKLLKDYSMEDSRKTSTPLDSGVIITKCKSCSNECQTVDRTMYQSLIWSLLYIGICSRPDILHSVCKLSQMNTNPHKENFVAAKHVLRYLASTIDYSIHYTKSGEDLLGYCDAYWGSNVNNRRSFTGYVFLLAGGPITWESKLQQTIALSSTEAEYMALSSTSKEVIYLRNLLTEMNLSDMVKKATKVFADNMGAIKLVKNPIYHSRTKHIDIRVHFVREVFENQQMEINHVSSEENIADIFTKNLAKIKHNFFLKKLNIN